METPRRALIVDDDPAVCELVQSVLTSTGMQVLALTMGTDATALLRDQKFSVLLFDLRMPPPDGIVLARQARRSGFNQTTPIILLSDDQSNAAVSEGFAAGASFFLYKPIDKGSLLKLMRATQGAIEHERRRFRRVALQSRVRLSFDNGEMEGETIDVSLNGMLVRAPRQFPIGSTVRVSLYLSPGKKPIVGSGLVVRTLGENRMGIQLNQLTMVESGRLHEFLLPLMMHEGAEAHAVRT
ncbi:MAG: response regulator [Candidatus Acidiferrales bacterium]|jgi:DNA-binding response OmpR family regulator